MNARELLATIRKEIEGRIKLYSVTNEKEQWIDSTYWSVLSFLDTLTVDAPEGLDEAAEKCVDDALFKWSWDDEDGIGQYVDDAFKAGAEWAFGQGETLERDILALDIEGKAVLSTMKLSGQYNFGDPVIVQIRKK